MRKKIYNRIMLLTVVSLLVCSAALSVVFYNQLSASVRADLRERAVSLKDLLAESPELYDFLAAADLRVTIVTSDGRVIYDDDENISGLASHADREEIQEALATGIGESKRFSDTLGRETYYYAVKLHNGDILRLAKTTSSIFGMLLSVLPLMILIILLVILAAYLFAGRLTRSIVQPINEIDPASAKSVPYDELVPFARTIKKQKEQIGAQLHELQSHSDTINAIMDNMQEGLALIDQQGILLSVNKSALSIFALTGNVQGRNVIELLRDLELHTHIQRALNGQHSETVYQHAGRVYQVFFSPSSNGGAMILLLDITERAEVEKMRREFSANVSHELKTPLASISGYAEMIVNGMVKDSDIPGFVGKIRDETARLIALVEDIMMLSELDEERSVLFEKEPVDLAKVAQEVCEALALKASEVSVSLHVHAPETIFHGNRFMLYELFFNLVDNGIKYNKPGGSVMVSVVMQNGQPVIAVSDTGIGIPKEHHHRVFERFYRVDKSRSKKTGGTGLGLSIVKHVAAAHGGTVEIESAQGKGTTITVRLTEIK